MKIAIGSDHAGFEYKRIISEHLKRKNYKVEDFGTYSNESCDYPEFIRSTAKAVAEGRCQRAIVLGGSGNGETMVANKVHGIRCALCWNEEIARLARKHNDANVISIGARTVPITLALKMVDIWLSTPFEGGRHKRRIDAIED